ncbi:MAG: Ig-like domain-containing protein [Ruminococcaceae bacterium]|nr:Ig-like domain-containing protein [Oscillospiraceae bacterium]
MKKRILSVVLAVCMLVSLLPVGMIGASALDADTYNDGNAYFRYYIGSVYQTTYNGPTIAQHNAKYTSIWNKAEGHSKYVKTPSAVTGASGGVPNLYGKDFNTDPFFIVMDGVSAFGKYYGIAGIAGKNVQVQILVPSTGTYTPKLNVYAANGFSQDISLYIAPVDEANLTSEDHLVGTVTMAASADANALYEYPAVDLDAGMYYYVLKANDSKQILGCSLELWGDEAPEVLEVAFDEAYLTEGAIEVPAGDGPVEIQFTGTSTRYAEDFELEYEINTAEVYEVPAELDAEFDIYTGILSLEASAVPANAEFNVTVLVNTYDGSDWIEVPVRIVAGSQRMLTLGHSGNNGNMQANLPTDITINALVDGEPTEILDELGDEVNVEIYKDGELYDGMDVDVANGVITITPDAAGSYVAKVTAIVDGVESAVAYEIPLTVSAISYYYNYMKILGSYYGSAALGAHLEDKIASFSDTWTGASTDAFPANISDGWYPGEYSGATGWRWQPSAITLGAYYQEQGAGNWTSAHIYVPIGGNYDVTSDHYNWATGGNLEYYIAPVDAEDPFTADYLVGTVNHNAAAASVTDVAVGNVDLAAGEYIVYYKGADTNAATAAYFIKGLKLTMTGDPTDTKAFIDMDVAPKFLSVGGTVTVAANILPAALNSAIAWESSNDDVATVSDGTVKAVGNGIATITATAADGGSNSFEVVVGTAAYNYKIQDAYVWAWANKGEASYVGTNPNTSSYYATLFDGVDTYEGVYGVPSLKSDPFVIDKNISTGETAMNGIVVNWDASAKNMGILFAYGDGDDGYVRTKIRVSEDGFYRMATQYDSNMGSAGAGTVYLAPVDAADPVAAEYLLGSYSGTQKGGKNGTQILFDEVKMEAGEYYITVKKSPRVQRYVSSNGQATKGLDYLTLYNYRLYKTANFSEVVLDTVDGAQVRTVGNQGLRFISSIDKNAVDFSKVVEYGTLLLPTADLNTNRDLVIDAEYNGHKAAKVAAVNKYKETDDTVEFTAVLIDIAPENYARSVTARAYAIMDDGSVVYGDAFTARSIYEVAKNGVSTATGAELEALEAIIAAVEG